MKKIIGLLCFSMLILFLFSCDFQIPTAIEVRGNPDLKFAAKMDIGEAFQDLLDPGADYGLLPCVNTVTRTYIIQKVVIDQELTYPGGGNASYVIPPGQPPLGTNNITMSVGFDNILLGFTLNPVIARVYLSGNTNLVNVLSVEIKVNSSDPSFDKTYTSVNKRASGVSGSTFNGVSLPGAASTNIMLPLSESGLVVNFEVSIPANTTIQSSWFSQNVVTEILIWVPLEFTASTGALIDIPEDSLFPSDQDLFGRESGDDSNPISDYVESLELSIVLNQNPFVGKELIIWSGPSFAGRKIEIKDTLKGNSFILPIDKKNMENINKPENYPFAPNFRITYKAGDILRFPWVLTTTEFIFKAKMNYRHNF